MTATYADCADRSGSSASRPDYEISRHVILSMVREADGVTVSVGLAADHGDDRRPDDAEAIPVSVHVVGCGIGFKHLGKDGFLAVETLELAGGAATEVRCVRGTLEPMPGDAKRSVTAVFFHGTRCCGSEMVHLD